MALFIDLILVLIVLLFTFISAKKGFVKVLVQTVGVIAAFVIAFTVSQPLANYTYDKLIEPPIISSLEETALSNPKEASDAVLNAIPDVFIKAFPDYSERISQVVSKGLENGVESAVETVSSNIVKPIVSKLLGLLYSVMILIVLLILVKILSKSINKLFSFSIVGSLNRFLGGLLGFIEGLIFAMFFCMIIALVLSSGKEFWFFTKENIEDTVLFLNLCKINPFIVLKSV